MAPFAQKNYQVRAKVQILGTFNKGENIIRLHSVLY